ncbi:mycothiol conjugate amidase Mca [Corynebacterium tapiri]|uniref:Mycothiol S-conjugate amidase n=1 Tax=Corynebacterium tapiri TaxID=1448266 RepID=A0A5C4U6V4_9CORY|nr:mycothiol conjugate amidase Mca [Corynebacterium tapiri]TNM00494.1 mycothiol conjugate amidase Mca [Corynebacterium tapiri]
MRLLAIHAHPDDESSKGAATTAMYAAQGHDVTVITCTGGERGDILNPAMDKPGIKEKINEVRREEMAQAAAALGINHHWLGYEDSGLPGEGEPLPEGCFATQPAEEVADVLIRHIRQLRPHVIITYDENGGYPHPDHLQVHAASMIAWDKAGSDYKPELGQPWAPQKLYYSHGFVFQRMQLLHDELLATGKMSPYESIMQRWDPEKNDIMSRVTTQVHAADYFGQREAALRAHATQIDPAGAFLASSVEAQQRLWPTEEFELAQSRVESTLPETDLFAGITEEN